MPAANELALAAPAARLAMMSQHHKNAISLGEIVERYGGELIGDPGIRVVQIATLEAAGPENIGFFTNERYLPQLKSTCAGAVIVSAAQRGATELPRIVSANPYAYLAKVSALLNPLSPVVPGTHATAQVDVAAVIGKGAEIGPFVVIETGAQIGERAVIGAGCYIGRNARIGNDTRLYPRVAILEACEIGERGILHSGVVIGADGFGIAMDEDHWIKVPQIGRVLIGDDVEIGANTTVDRGAIENTVIEDGVKLDNQIQIAHNVRIGAHTAMAACAGVAGSARIGRYCRIGGASGIAGHITIADHVEVSAHTLITKSIDKPGTYTGAYPFDTNREWRHNAAALRHLEKLVSRVTELEKVIAGKERGK